MARTDKMKLGTFVYTFGFHPASWLHPASDVNGANDFAHLLDVAKRSEAAKFDFMPPSRKKQGISRNRPPNNDRQAIAVHTSVVRSRE